MHLHEAFAESNAEKPAVRISGDKNIVWFLSDDIPARLAIRDDWEPYIKEKEVEKLTLVEAMKKWKKFKPQNGPFAGHFELVDMYEQILMYISINNEKLLEYSLSAKELTEKVWIEVK